MSIQDVLKDRDLTNNLLIMLKNEHFKEKINNKLQE